MSGTCTVNIGCWLTISHSQAVRTSPDAINPVYVSVGHKISLETAVKLVLSCSIKRVPEPVRQVCIQLGVNVCVCANVALTFLLCKADLLSRKYLRKEKTTHE